MTPAEAHKAILATWIVQWPIKAGGSEEAPTVPYAIDNRRFEQVDGEFARIQIVNLAGEQSSLGPAGRRRFTRSGFIDVKLYGPVNQGRGSIDTLAQYVKEIFEGVRLSAGQPEPARVMTFTATTAEQRGDREFPDRWIMTVRTPFEYFETR